MKERIIFAALLCLCMQFTALAQQKIKVACLGNSITAGATISNPAVDGYPAQLQNLLGDSYDVRNFGQNSTTVQMRGRDKDDPTEKYAYRKSDKYQQVKAFKPDIIVIKLGTNDSKDCNWLEDSPQVFEQDLKDMLDDLKTLSSNPKIYLCYPLRVKNPDWTINEKNLHVIMPIIKSVADEYGLDVINLHTAFEREKDDQWNTLYNDGVHPNTEGAGIIAKYVRNAIVDGELNNPDDISHPKVQVVSCMGGLITFGAGGLTNRNTEAYPVVLQSLLGKGYAVTNAGIGNRTWLKAGTEQNPATSSDPKPCAYIDNSQFLDKVLNLEPDIVTIMLGDMDAKPWNWQHKDELSADMKALVDKIYEASPSVKIYICLPTRLKNNVNENGIDAVVLRDEVIPAIRHIAEEELHLPVIDLSNLLEDSNQYYSGNYYPNAAGHVLIAEAIKAAIAPGNATEGLSRTKIADGFRLITSNSGQQGAVEVISPADFHGDLRVSIFQMGGALVRSAQVSARHGQMSTTGLNGCYIYTITADGRTVQRGKLVIANI